MAEDVIAARVIIEDRMGAEGAGGAGANGQAGLLGELKTIFSDMRNVMKKDSTFGVGGGGGLGGLLKGVGGTLLGGLLAGGGLLATLFKPEEMEEINTAIDQLIDNSITSISEQFLESITGKDLDIDINQGPFSYLKDVLGQIFGGKKAGSATAEDSSSMVTESPMMSELGAFDKPIEDAYDAQAALNEATERYQRIMEDGVVTAEEQAQLAELILDLETERANVTDMSMSALENQTAEASGLKDIHSQWLDLLIMIGAAIDDNVQSQHKEAQAIAEVNKAMRDRIALERKSKDRGLRTVNIGGKEYRGQEVTTRALGTKFVGVREVSGWADSIRAKAAAERGE